MPRAREADRAAASPWLGGVGPAPPPPQAPARVCLPLQTGRLFRIVERMCGSQKICKQTFFQCQFVINISTPVTGYGLQRLAHWTLMPVVKRQHGFLSLTEKRDPPLSASQSQSGGSHATWLCLPSPGPHARPAHHTEWTIVSTVGPGKP